MSLLEVSSLSVRYPDNDQPSVCDLSFSMEKGESLGIVGESGAGKSQTALAIMGLLPSNARQSGSVQLAGVEVLQATDEALRQLRATKVSMVFQDPATALNPYLKVGQQLSRIFFEHHLASFRGAKKKSIELLERVGLPDPAKQYRSYPHQLSGGMRQRAMIAAALIGEPDLIVADEPTTALDVTVQAQILNLLHELQQDLHTALLVITHDLGVIARSCQSILVMDQGRLIEEGATRDVIAQPKHPHTSKLMAAAPHLDTPPPVPREGPARTIVAVDKLRIRYRDRRRGGRGDFVAVESLDLEIREGETLAIVGESGSGKTSLARCIAGLLRGRSGSVSIDGERQPWRVESRSKSIRRMLQMVFQDPQSSLNPMMRIGRIVAEPLVVHSGSLKARDISKQVAEILQRVGLDPSLSERHPHELSGGQAQRVAIARALAPDPGILICDEALAALDGTVRREILTLLKNVQRESNLTLVLITHDLGVVREIADRVVVMCEGKIVETASNEELFANPQQQYTKDLLAAVPTID